MSAHFDLTGLAIVVLAASLLGYAMTRLKQSPIVGYILAGVILGPSVLGLVEDRAGIELLAELGVLLLLFVIGLELSLETIRTSWRTAVTAALLQIAASVGAMLILALFFGWSWPFAILLGFVVALSSTAVVVRMLTQMDIVRQPVGQLTVSILIAQDLAFIPMVLTVGAMKGGTFELVDALRLVSGIAVLGLLLWYLGQGRTVKMPFSSTDHRRRELVPLRGLMFCFGLAALAGVLGLSAAYGAFLAGLILGNSNERRLMHVTMQPIEAVLMMVFFLLIGLLIDLGFIVDNFGRVFLVLAAVVVLKTAMNIGILHMLKEPWPHAVIAGILMAQIGEFSFLLGQIGLGAGILDSDDSKLIVSVTALSLMITPIWMTTARRVMRLVVLSINSGQETVRVVFGHLADPLMDGARALRGQAARLSGWRRTSGRGSDGRPTEDGENAGPRRGGRDGGDSWP